MRNIGRMSRISSTASTGTAKTSRSMPSVTNCASWLCAAAVMASDPFKLGIAAVGAARGEIERKAAATVGAHLGLDRSLGRRGLVDIGVAVAFRGRLGGRLRSNVRDGRTARRARRGAGRSGLVVGAEVGDGGLELLGLGRE